MFSQIDGPEGSEEMEVSKEGNEGGTEVVVKYTPPVQGEYKVRPTKRMRFTDTASLSFVAGLH